MSKYHAVVDSLKLSVWNSQLPQDFGEVVKNSWKSWQSYYQLKLPDLSEFSGQVADTTNMDTKPSQNASEPRMFFMDDRYATTLKRNDDAAARNLGTMINQIRGFKMVQPKLDHNQSASQLMLSSTPKDGEHLPNLLIYFPHPLNIFIYYSIGSQNNTVNISSLIDDKDNSKSELGTRMFNSDSYIPEDYDDNPNFYNKTNRMDKQKEFEFIRKIIRDLINYWDDEERSLGKFNKSSDSDVGIKMGNFDGKPPTITNAQTDETKSKKAEAKPDFNQFLEWLSKTGHINSSILSESSLKKNNPLVSETLVESPNRLISENNKNVTSGKIRILVDIDKNQEIIKKLLSKNTANIQNDSDSRHNQVIVNLDDYVKPQEKDLISQSLIDMASKQLHPNINGNEKMPKVLWVFPVYGNEGNETIINEIKKRSKEKVNTLEDVDAPTAHTDNKDGFHYVSNNSYANNQSGKVDHIENSDNYSGPNVHNSNKDTEDEYYDDQDGYDEDDYEQSGLRESMEN